jgi:hypothetical protein
MANVPGSSSDCLRLRSRLGDLASERDTSFEPGMGFSLPMMRRQAEAVGRPACSRSRRYHAASLGVMVTAPSDSATMASPGPSTFRR